MVSSNAPNNNTSLGSQIALLGASEIVACLELLGLKLEPASLVFLDKTILLHDLSESGTCLDLDVSSQMLS